jgi:hypothetical protein
VVQCAGGAHVVSRLLVVEEFAWSRRRASWCGADLQGPLPVPRPSGTRCAFFVIAPVLGSI